MSGARSGENVVMSAAGKPVPHESAEGHVTGGAPYVEDVPRTEGELHCVFVGAPVAAGRLVRVDVSAALAVDGVACALTADDLPGHNTFGPIMRDEPVLASGEVHYLDQPVVVVAGETRAAAEAGAAAVVVEVDAAEPVLTIDAARKAGRQLGPVREIRSEREDGALDRAFVEAAHTLEGTFTCNGQEQLYLESQACIAYPGEGRQLRLLSSTQNPTETQAVVAEVLGLGMHEVVCECRRMGGGFGGKETQSAIPALMVALVASTTGRPARIVYGKSRDMAVTGKRHAYVARYAAAFDDDGVLEAVTLDFDSNAGAFADLSTSIMERTMLHADNAYVLPNVRITGRIWRTNLPPNTAFRGFGGPQGVVVIETVLQEIAARLGLDALAVRRANLYVDGDPTRNRTPYGQVVRDHVLHAGVDRLAAEAGYAERLAAVGRFNATSPTRLRGLALTCIKFGISFTTKFLNQGNALVNVFTDGTVQVSTGGTEMGQGLNTKVRQLVADRFGIDWRDVQVMATSTEKNHNTSPTAASAGTDLNGSAAVEACDQIRGRMAAYAARLFADADAGRVESAAHVAFASGFVYDVREGLDGDTGVPNVGLAFGVLCDMARRDRIDLGARGFYATPGVDFNRETGRGHPFFYYTTGAALAEVEVDRFTGDVSVERVDLLMDIGRSINPGIDRGQIIGGFVQGMGWCTTEELVYGAGGALLSTSPTTYKIPASTDVPAVFNVGFLDNPKHKVNVRQSKAVGEPPLMLGVSVFQAVKHALSFVDGAGQLRLPATNAEVLRCLSGAEAGVDEVRVVAPQP